jgi:hypothetical protein
MSEEGIVATWLAKCYGCDAAETVKTVPEAARSPNTPLKWGVNEKGAGKLSKQQDGVPAISATPPH